jgi:hypothetical protein
LSQDIPDACRKTLWTRPASVEGLVVADWVDGQRTEELALLGHNPDLSASHEDMDGFVPVSCSDADVSEAAAVAQGDRAGLVDAVVTDTVLDGSELSSGSGLDPGGEAWVGVRPSGTISIALWILIIAFVTYMAVSHRDVARTQGADASAK